jgi:hypothetical protein
VGREVGADRDVEPLPAVILSDSDTSPLCRPPVRKRTGGWIAIASKAHRVLKTQPTVCAGSTIPQDRLEPGKWTKLRIQRILSEESADSVGDLSLSMQNSYCRDTRSTDRVTRQQTSAAWPSGPNQGENRRFRQPTGGTQHDSNQGEDRAQDATGSQGSGEQLGGATSGT